MFYGMKVCVIRPDTINFLVNVWLIFEFSEAGSVMKVFATENVLCSFWAFNDEFRGMFSLMNVLPWTRECGYVFFVCGVAGWTCGGREGKKKGSSPMDLSEPHLWVSIQLYTSKGKPIRMSNKKLILTRPLRTGRKRHWRGRVLLGDNG